MHKLFCELQNLEPKGIESSVKTAGKFVLAS